MAEFRVGRLRYERAKKHGEQLAQMWNTLPDEYLCKLKPRVGPDGKRGELLVVDVNPVPDEFSLCLGEMLYQLRSMPSRRPTGDQGFAAIAISIRLIYFRDRSASSVSGLAAITPEKCVRAALNNPSTAC